MPRHKCKILRFQNNLISLLPANTSIFLLSDYIWILQQIYSTPVLKYQSKRPLIEMCVFAYVRVHVCVV